MSHIKIKLKSVSDGKGFEAYSFSRPFGQIGSLRSQSDSKAFRTPRNSSPNCCFTFRLQKCTLTGVFVLAEGKGFEPLEPVKARQFSKLLLSTTQPTFRV